MNTPADGRNSTPRPDPETVAKIVNSAWAVTRDRLAAGHRDWSDYFIARTTETDTDRRAERIEAALYDVFRRLDDVDDLAREAIERAEAAA